MKVALLNTKATLRSDYILEAFAAGLKSHDDEPLWVRERKDQHLLDRADVGVQICYPNRHHDGSDLPLFRLEAFERLTALGKRILTIDTGFVHNQPEAELRKTSKILFHVNAPSTYREFDRSIYYAAGYDGLKRKADYGTQGDVPGDRWKRLAYKLLPWRKRGKHIVLIGQPLHGQSTQHLDIRSWYANTVKEIRRLSPLPIVYRPHPRVFSLRTNPVRREREEQMIRSAIGKTPQFSCSQNRFLNDDLSDAHATVVLTSNAAVESILRGVPVIACDSACMAWDVAEHKLASIERPRTPERLDWIRKLAYSQWSVGEMRTGACWRHLRPIANKEPA